MVYTLHLPDLDEPAHISARPASTTIAAGHGFSFDAEGRILTASIEGRFFKRGLDHRVMEKQRAWTPGRRDYLRRDLPDDEKSRLVEYARATALRVMEALPPDARETLQPRFDAIKSWNSQRYDEDRRRFELVYRPVGILPPDQYMALVLQATEGCHYNKCTFCTFYRDTPFHIKDPATFRSHVAEVLDLVGDGRLLRETIFLADANALVAPRKRLIPLFQVLQDAFDIAPAGLQGKALVRWRAMNPRGITGIYSFIDAFTGYRKSEEDFAEMVALGLRRIYVGAESGHAPLLDFLRKPGTPDEVLRVIRSAKAAGLEVAVIVMLGIGGDRFAADHVADTLALLRRAELGEGDLVYLSEYVAEPGSEYERDALAAGIMPLPPEAVARQAALFRKALRRPAGPRVATYDIREFIY